MRNGNRRTGLLILALSLLIFGCQLPWTVPQQPKVTPTATPTATPERFDPPRIGYVRVDEAVVYEKPDASSPELLRLPAGTAVVVLARLENWVEIALPGTDAGSGWILLETVVITTESAGAPLAGQPAAFATAVVVTGATSLRAGPGTVYPAVLAVRRGQALGVIGQIDACAWVKVIADERVSGWIPGNFVSLDQPCELFPALVPPPTPRPTRPTSTPTFRPPPPPPATWTPTPTRRPTRTPTPTAAFSATPTASPMISATATGTLAPTATATSIISSTATSTPSPTAVVSPTNTPTTAAATDTPTVQPTDTPTTAAPTNTPTTTAATDTPTTQPTDTPTAAAPTNTPTSQPVATDTPTTAAPTNTPTMAAPTNTPTAEAAAATIAPTPA